MQSSRFHPRPHLNSTVHTKIDPALQHEPGVIENKHPHFPQPVVTRRSVVHPKRQNHDPTKIKSARPLSSKQDFIQSPSLTTPPSKPNPENYQ